MDRERDVTKAPKETTVKHLLGINFDDKVWGSTTPKLGAWLQSTDRREAAG